MMAVGTARQRCENLWRGRGTRSSGKEGERLHGAAWFGNTKIMGCVGCGEIQSKNKLGGTALRGAFTDRQSGTDVLAKAIPPKLKDVME